MLKVAQALTADTSSSSEVESSLIGTEDLFSNKALHNNLRSGQHPICSIVNKQPTEKGLMTDMERQKSSELCDASPKKDHEAGASDPRKRKIEDTEDGEAHEGSGFTCSHDTSQGAAKCSIRPNMGNQPAKDQEARTRRR